jgi:sporulation protein YlmC with PRC-barrel domain
MNSISNLYGRRIYTQDSTYVGVAKDVLIDPTEGKIKYLLREEASDILGRDTVEARKFIKENFIPFERVVAVRDIIVIR